MGFRDDREALIAKLRALEQELESVRAQADREVIAREIAEITEAVEAAEERLESDRAALGEISARIDGLRARVGVPASEASAPPAAPRTDPGAPRGCLVAGGVLAALLIGLVVLHASDDSPLPGQRGPGGPAVASLPGGVHRFDPAAGLAEARELAAGLPLTSIELRYVSSDGTIDLDHAAYDGSAIYQFDEPAPDEPADPSIPLGAPRGDPFHTSVYVRVDAQGFHVDRDDLAILSGPALPWPECTPVEVWRAARAQGAPPSAIATLRYRSALGEASEWHLTIDGTGVDVRVPESDCRR